MFCSPPPTPNLSSLLHFYKHLKIPTFLSHTLPYSVKHAKDAHGMNLGLRGLSVFGQIRVTQAKDTGKVVTSASENVEGHV